MSFVGASIAEGVDVDNTVTEVAGVVITSRVVRWAIYDYRRARN